MYKFGGKIINFFTSILSILVMQAESPNVTVHQFFNEIKVQEKLVVVVIR